MRISELSKRSGVTVPTIKYYLREGLLHPGTPTGATQADYDASHLQRLHFIRVMIEVGRLPVSAIRDVVAALGDADRSTHDVLGVAHRALAVRSPAAVAGSVERAEVTALVQDLGWAASADPTTVEELARALSALRVLGWQVTADSFRPYAAAADAIAAREISYVYDTVDRSESVERVVIGTVVFETVLTALRRLAEAHHSSIVSEQAPTSPRPLGRPR